MYKLRKWIIVFESKQFTTVYKCLLCLQYCECLPISLSCNIIHAECWSPYYTFAPSFYYFTIFLFTAFAAPLLLSKGFSFIFRRTKGLMTYVKGRKVCVLLMADLVARTRVPLRRLLYFVCCNLINCSPNISSILSHGRFRPFYNTYVAPLGAYLFRLRCVLLLF